MKAGATYNLIVKLPEITDEPSEQEIIDEIIFTIQCGSVKLSKVYPGDVSLAGDIYIIPLNQAETKQLVGNCQLEAQVNYTNKAVQKSYIQSFTVSDTLATKDVDGVPDAIHNSELILRLIGSSVLVISIVPEVADEIIKNMNKLYLATKQAMEDTQSYGEQTKSDLQLKLQDALNSINDVAIGQLESINNTAQAQIEAINSSAAAAGESQREGINTVASNQISNITNVTNQQLTNINTVAISQIRTIEGKTYIQINNINDTATRQLSAINDTATSQLSAINKTSQSQVQNMTVKYSDMCRTLGIEHEGIINITRNKNVSIDVRKYKYIKFGTANTKGSNFKDYTLPPEYDWCSINCDKKEIDFTAPKPSDSIFKITSNKEYDISTFDDLYLYYSSRDDTDYGYINYKLYNKSEETTEE